MKIKLTQEEIDTMSYDDVAYLVLDTYKKKMKIQDLFQKVIKAMNLPDEEFTNGIGDFFELLLTDKRFVMLEDGNWDLKINHSTKVVFDDEDEDLELLEESEEIDIEEEAVDADVNYDEDKVEDDDSEDELEDLVILDENDDNELL